MKKNKTRMLSDGVKSAVLIACVAAAFVIFISVISTDRDMYESVYNSTYSANRSGTLALYYSAEEMGRKHGFSVSRHHTLARFIEERSIVTCFGAAQSRNIDTEYEKDNIRRQLQNGYVYVFLDDLPENIDFENMERFVPDFYDENEYEYDWSFFRVNGSSGFIAACGEFDGQNGSVKENSEFAVDYLAFITSAAEVMNIKNVVFNEFYSGMEEDYTVNIITLGVILFIVQLCIATVVLMLSRAKRFGAPRIEYTTVKRDENENVYAVASLYKRTESYDVVFDINMELLLADAGHALGVGIKERYDYDLIIGEARGSDVEKLPGMRELIAAYTKPKKKVKNKKDLRRKLNTIEALRRSLSDGSEKD